jgi:hypothetical protein
MLFHATKPEADPSTLLRTGAIGLSYKGLSAYRIQPQWELRRLSQGLERSGAPGGRSEVVYD